jgi:hypothetical protein
VRRLVPQFVRRYSQRYGGLGATARSLIWPRTFTEKIQRRKLLDRDPRLPRLQDKVLVKDYVAQRLGEEWVTPTLWSGETLPPRELRTWPAPFVIKANNASARNIFVRQPGDLDWDAIERTVESWRTSVFGADLGEWLYAEIKPMLLVEPHVGDPSTTPPDYKFYVFGGEVKLIQVDTDREGDHKRCLFDLGWNPLPFALDALGQRVDTRPMARPSSLERMIDAAQMLSAKMPFVRIDFYEVEQRPKFGEFTFYPGSGLLVFDPPEWDLIIGRWWR